MTGISATPHGSLIVNVLGSFSSEVKQCTSSRTFLTTQLSMRPPIDFDQIPRLQSFHLRNKYITIRWEFPIFMSLDFPRILLRFVPSSSEDTKLTPW